MWDSKEPYEINCISAVSFDDGKTWKSYQFSGKSSADPWCIITSKGEAVFSLLNNDTMWTYHSADGGISWKNAISHGAHHDHETMTVAEHTKNSSRIYLVSVQAVKNKDGKGRESVFVTSSADGGRSFSDKVNLIQNNLWKNTMTPVVLSDGTLLLSYNEYAYRTSKNNYVSLIKNHSWTISSKDSGRTFSEPRFITDRSAGFPVLEVDKSEKHKDRIYWVTTAENGKQILCLYSSDQGERWSDPVVVSRSVLTKAIPNIGVSKNGIIGVTWYEKDSVRFCQNMYFASSLDGGQTFSSPIRVSDQTSCADSTKNGKALRGGWSSGGHYTGIVATDKGNFILVWADARSGRYQLYITEITVLEHIKN